LAMCRERAAASLRADWPSGKAPTDWCTARSFRWDDFAIPQWPRRSSCSGRTPSSATHASPKGLCDVFHPTRRNAGEIHLDQGFFDRTLAPPLVPDDRGLPPNLGNIQPEFAGLGVQPPLVVAGSGVATNLGAIVALHITQPICLSVQQRVQRLLPPRTTWSRWLPIRSSSIVRQS